MQNLTAASAELFRRSPDEVFESLTSLHQHCASRRAGSLDRWHPPNELRARAGEGGLGFAIGDQAPFRMNDWSFSQLCRLAGVSKDTVNRVSSDTASQIFAETLPQGGNKPLQLYTEGDLLRSMSQSSRNSRSTSSRLRRGLTERRDSTAGSKTCSAS